MTRAAWVVLATALLSVLGLVLGTVLPTGAAGLLPTHAAPATTAAPRVLPSEGDVDYQLGGPRAVPDHVSVVVRDREARPAPGRFNVCYVNGFQTQPGERSFWRNRMGLVLRRHGRPVTDSEWGEWLLDTRTERKRTRLARIVGRWTDRCAADGFDAVELDNLDSFTRSRGLIRRKHAVAFARLLVDRANRAGLAAAQKNFAELDGTRLGFDFAIAEECGRYRECGRYVASYGRRVLVIEYRQRDFTATCAGYGDRLAVLLADRMLRPDGRRRWC